MPTKTVDLLYEFERRYKGDPSMTMLICGEIAKEFGLDVEVVADYVYLHRYEDSESLEGEDWPEEEIEGREY